MSKSHKAPKQNFKPRKLTGVEKKAAQKAALANSPQLPNRDMSMKTSLT